MIVISDSHNIIFDHCNISLVRGNQNNNSKQTKMSQNRQKFFFLQHYIHVVVLIHCITYCVFLVQIFENVVRPLHSYSTTYTILLLLLDFFIIVNIYLNSIL